MPHPCEGDGRWASSADHVSEVTSACSTGRVGRDGGECGDVGTVPVSQSAAANTAGRQSVGLMASSLTLMSRMASTCVAGTTDTQYILLRWWSLAVFGEPREGMNNAIRV